MAGKKTPRTKSKKPEPALGASSRTGRAYDPFCGSGGMFVSSEKFIEAQQGKIGDTSIYGQESNDTSWRLARTNLAIRGIDAQIAHGDTFHDDRHPDLKANHVLANGSMSSMQSGAGEIEGGEP